MVTNMEQFFQPIKLSLVVSISALMIVSVIGLLCAWLMEKKQFKGKVILDTVLLLPIVLPPTVIGFLLIMLFGNNSVVGQIIQFLFDTTVMFTVGAAIIAAVIVALPLMYQTTRTGISLVDQHVEDAARVDGASELDVFRLITFPLIRKSFFTGITLAFARALGEFGATLMFAGNIPGKTQTIPTAIYVAIESNQMQLAWAWVVTIIVVSYGMLLIIRKSA
ncbi:molybdate ABC transporter permease subunit [Gracilibacillus marinus]|jgi:molybdate transport system permease protein